MLTTDNRTIKYIDPSSAKNYSNNNDIQFNQAKKFIAYFQAYTNTYDKVEVLQERYEKALSHPDIVGLSVSTRPDTLSQGALDLLDDIGKKYLVWLELGLQTIHDRTNELLNSWHTFEQFKTTLLKAKEKPNLKICTHLILGLPGETIEDMHQTIDTVTQLPIDGYKLHLLHVIKNTKLYEDYLKGEVPIFEEDPYVSLVCDILEKIPSHVWEDIKDFVMPYDKEISKQLKLANVGHYAIKYNSFTAVNSKWDK